MSIEIYPEFWLAPQGGPCVTYHVMQAGSCGYRIAGGFEAALL